MGSEIASFFVIDVKSMWIPDLENLKSCAKAKLGKIVFEERQLGGHKRLE